MAQDPNFRPDIPSELANDPEMEWLILLIKECWQHEAQNRPTFAEILDRFSDYAV